MHTVCKDRPNKRWPTRASIPDSDQQPDDGRQPGLQHHPYPERPIQAANQLFPGSYKEVSHGMSGRKSGIRRVASEFLCRPVMAALYSCCRVDACGVEMRVQQPVFTAARVCWFRTAHHLTSNGDVRLPWPLRHGTDRSDSSSAGANIGNVGNLTGVKGEQHCTAFYYVRCG